MPHRERDVLEEDVLPGDVLRETIATCPRFEASSVERVLHNNIIDRDVVNRGDRASLAERADGKTVPTLAVGVAEDDVGGTRADSETVVTILNVIVLEEEVAASSGEAVPRNNVSTSATYNFCKHTC